MQTLNIHKLIQVAIGLTLLVFAWQYLAANFNGFRLLFSSPEQLLSYAQEHSVKLSKDVFHTLFIALMGFLLALVTGFTLAFIGSSIKSLEKPFLAFSSIMQTIPIIVFVPFLIITLGAGFTSKIILASLMSLFVVLTSTMISLDEVKSEYREFLELYEVSNFDRYWKVLIPAALASIVGSLRVAAGLAILGAIVVEFTGAKYGLGKNIFLSSIRIEPELMMLSVLACCLIGAMIHKLFTYIENKHFWWRE